MKTFIPTFVLLIFTSTKSISLMSAKIYSYLALGDSYTIGESVRANENFPNQTVALLRKKGFDFSTSEIIAKTGWTTDELQSAISQHHLKNRFDFVTLLIGVNNQYRGRSAGEYEKEFDSLLKQAIGFAGNDINHVIIISIPDWGVTPFAQGSNRTKIAEEIDTYNSVTKKIASQYKVHYVDITPGTREAATDLSLLAGDGLHPSAKEYKRWAEKISAIFLSELQQIRML